MKFQERQQVAAFRAARSMHRPTDRRRPSLPGWTAIVLASSLPALFPLLHHDSSDRISKVWLSGLLLLCTTALCWRTRWLRPLAVTVCLLLATNLTLSLFAHVSYRHPFNDGLAMSIILTHPREAFGMLTLYWPYLLALPAGCALFLLPAITLSRHSGRRPLVVATALLVTYAGYSWLKAACMDDPPADRKVPSVHLLRKSALFNGSHFAAALHDQPLFDRIARHPVRHRLTVTDSGIDTYVLVIGESARKSHHSLYGYPRDTTPHARRRQDAMLVFDQAIAGAPLTNLAVPLALSASHPARHDPLLYADNVIHIANQAGFRTFWYSKQEAFGLWASSISGIALSAGQQHWVHGAHDGALLAPLREALATPGRKLIVLHLNGSHPPACARFPPHATVFTGGEPADDCYDNSIRYTDALLGQIFPLLDRQKASLLYFSDHGLERQPQRHPAYVHGGGLPSRQAFDVPQFIWYSRQVAATSRRSGRVTGPYSTADNFELIQDWLGVGTGRTSCRSPLARCYRRDDNVHVVTASRDSMPYARLRERPD